MLRLILALLLFTTIAPALRAQQSLYHVAVQLDSLYDRVDAGDEAAAEIFFAELRALYGETGLVGNAAVRADFAENEFLSRKVSIVFGALKSREASQGALVQSLYTSRDSLFEAAILTAEEYCNAQNCAARPQLDALKAKPTIAALIALRESVVNKQIKTYLQSVEVEVYLIDRRLEREETIVETVLQLSAAASDGMSFGGNQAQGLNSAPVILQQKGPSSLQANVIDGASKWIAARMREELSIAFFDRFGEWISEQNIRVLFPNTFLAISNSMTTDYSLMLPIFQSAFDKDLKALPFSTATFLRLELDTDESVNALNTELLDIYANLDSIQQIEDSIQLEVKLKRDNFAQLKADQLAGKPIDLFDMEMAEMDLMLSDLDMDFEVAMERDNLNERLDAIRVEQRQNGEVLRYALFTIEALNQLSRGDHPANLLEHLGREADQFFPMNSRVQPALTIVAAFSKALLNTDPERGTAWVKGSDLNRLRTDAGLRDIFFGLLYQEVILSLRRQKTRLLTEQSRLAAELLNGEPEQRAARLTYSRMNDLDEAIHNQELNFLLFDENDLNDKITSLLENDYADRDAATRQGIEDILRRYYSTTQSIISRHDDFDSDEFSRLASNYKSSLNAARDTVWSLAQDNVLYDDVDDVYESVYYVTKLFPENTEDYEKLSGDAYRNVVDSRIGGILGFGLEEEDFQTEVRGLMQDVMAASVDLRVYLDRVYPELETARLSALSKYRRQTMERDSAQIIADAWRKQPTLRNYDLRIRQLAEQREFVDNALVSRAGGMAKTLNGFIQITNQLDQVSADYKRISQQGNANLGSAQFVYLLRTSLGLVEEVFRIAIPQDVETLNRVSGLVDNVFNAYAGVLEKDYDATLLNLVPMANSLVKEHYETRIFQEELNGRPTQQLEEQQARQELRLQEIFRYGAFLAAVAEAESSDQIKDAIQSIALPAGSYSIKRRALGNISLNAYPGLTGGMEVVRPDGTSQWAPNFGFTAPIGLAFSWGYRKKIDALRYINEERYRKKVDRSPRLRNDRFLNGSSGSLFLPLVDLGAVVLFRLDGSTESLPEDVGFQQVFSPGFIYSHGFSRVPISVMAGMQVSPLLRKFGDEQENAFRFNLGVTVDLPMVNFYTRREERKIE